MKTQQQQIEEDLKNGAKLTPIDALKRYGCFRLGARIKNLRNQGMPIKTKMIEISGKRFAEYSL